MNIEVIAIAIGAVATVLGGVWFMLQKAFGYGRLVSRIDDVHHSVRRMPHVMRMIRQ